MVKIILEVNDVREGTPLGRIANADCMYSAGLTEFTEFLPGSEDLGGDIVATLAAAKHNKCKRRDGVALVPS